MKRETLQRVSMEVDRMLNGSAGQKTTAYVIFVFPFKDAGSEPVAYMSNVERGPDVLTVVKSAIGKLEELIEPKGRLQ